MINAPPTTAVDKNGDSVSQSWLSFFNSVYGILSALTQSGTSDQRPTKLLWVGRTYFDTTLGKPIWYSGLGWVLADGTSA